MEEYKATFEIESKSDAHAVERSLSRLYDSLREESRTIRKGTNNSTEMLEQFESIRDATCRQKPGKLTVVYEQKEEPFDGSE